ncbi:MAG: hypothetical protein OEY11_12255 [Gammaproteobacteria bacterium]|nr:hypothetical protein [Gammaproteobacteria bacterium]
MFSLLIEHGHNIEQLKKYSERKLLMFFKYAQRSRNLTRADELDNLSIVFAGKEHPMSKKLRA